MSDQTLDPPSDSILNVTKKLLNIPAEYTAFDLDIVTHINAVFVVLRDLGVGPKIPFFVSDAMTPWVAFTENNPSLEMVKPYLALKVRLVFDTPPNSFTIDAIKAQISEYEFRLHLNADEECP